MNAVWRSGLLGLVLALGLTACASMDKPVQGYEGPARPVAELAVLSVPEEIQVLAVDGREVGGGLLGQRTLKLQVLPGEHVLSVRYVQLFQINADEHDIVRSRPAALRFVAKAGSRYEFRYDKPKNREIARQFAKEPSFALVDQGSGEATQSVAVKSYAEASLVDTISKAFEGNKEATPVTNLDLLKDVWGRASAEDRAAFKAWVESGK